MIIFESKITEFIGLACYLANRYYSVKEIPLGPVEKMLSIAKHLFDIDIPNLETVITPRGSQHLVMPGLIAYQKPLYIRNLPSRYFTIETRGHSTFLKPTKEFGDSLNILVGKPYFSDFDSCLHALVELWSVIKYNGLMLIDMTRLCDGGIRFLVADLENAVTQLLRYIQGGNHIPSALDYRNRFENALDAFRDKTKVLQNASDLFSRAEAECRSPRVCSLLHRLTPLHTSSVFFALLQELYNLVSDVGRSILANSPDTRDRIHNAIKRFNGWSQQKLAISNTPSENLEQFLKSLDAWLLALCGLSRPELYLEKSFSAVGGERPAIAATDFRKFTLKLDNIESKFGTIGTREVYEWFGRVRATVRNWWVVFNGALSATGVEEGDAFFACFPTTKQAIHASALAVCHLELLDSCSFGALADLRCSVKIGVEKRTAARIINGVDISTAANDLFHTLGDMEDRCESLQHKGSLLFANSSTLQEYGDLQKYVKETVGENIIILDHEGIAKSLFAKTEKPLSARLF